MCSSSSFCPCSRSVLQAFRRGCQAHARSNDAKRACTVPSVLFALRLSGARSAAFECLRARSHSAPALLYTNPSPCSIRGEGEEKCRPFPHLCSLEASEPTAQSLEFISSLSVRLCRHASESSVSSPVPPPVFTAEHSSRRSSPRNIPAASPSLSIFSSQGKFT